MREREGGREREREPAYYIVDDDDLLLPAPVTPSRNHWHCFNHWFTNPLRHSQPLSALMMAVDLFPWWSSSTVATYIFPQFIRPKIGSMWHAHVDWFVGGGEEGGQRGVHKDKIEWRKLGLRWLWWQGLGQAMSCANKQGVFNVVEAGKSVCMSL